MKNIKETSSRARGIYLLPNLLTTLGLFAGFFAIIASMKQHFDSAGIAIFVAMIMDALDGRIARYTHTQTAFGVQYDSLSDMVSFGVAPALVVYSWALLNLGKIGWLVAFFFTAASALRLARFNTQAEAIDKKYFQGLATTPSAGILASMVWAYSVYGRPNFVVSIVIALITFVIAGLMVSNIRYRSFKEIDFKGRISFIKLFFIVLILIAVAMDPAKVLFVILFSYGLSGPVMTLIRLHRTKRYRKRNRSEVKKS